MIPRGNYIRPPKNLNKPKLSVFLGAIRPDNWEALYNSIVASVGKYSFELCLCGPHNLPTSLLSHTNIKIVRDFGSPARGAQIASLVCEGELVTLGADDGLYLPGGLERAINFYESKKEEKLVVVLKYGENGNMWPNDFWVSWYHPYLRLPGIPHDSMVLLNNLMRREYWYEIGGFDCELFDTTNWGGHDLSQRLKNDGAKIVLYDKEHVLTCTWMNVNEGDHMPIHYTDYEPYEDSIYHTYKKLYMQPNTTRSRLDINNWIKAEAIWAPRWKEDGSERQFEKI